MDTEQAQQAMDQDPWADIPVRTKPLRNNVWVGTKRLKRLENGTWVRGGRIERAKYTYSNRY